jgi:hypothetical protein
MSDRVLRGSRLGAVSYESDRNTDLAPRQAVTFDCPTGHHFSVPFAVDAEVPATWECRLCGKTALRSGGAVPAPKKSKPVRTHMDMIRERRSTADLEAVLKEQLAARASASKKKKSA